MSCCLRRMDSNDDLSATRSIESGLTIKEHLQGRGDSAVIFEKIFHDQVLKKELLALCEKHYCTEVFYFIRDFLEWKKNQTEQGAKNLLNNYINSDAEYAINVVWGDYDRISELLNNYDNNKEQVLQELQKCFSSVAIDLRGNLE